MIQLRFHQTICTSLLCLQIQVKFKKLKRYLITMGLLLLKKSKTGKYISVSIVLSVENSDLVISFYKKAEKIKGIISL